VYLFRQHDVCWLDDLCFEAGGLDAMDHAYMDFRRLHRIAQSGPFFVIRAKDNLQLARRRSQPVDMQTGLRSDQIGQPDPTKTPADFPSLLRKVRYYDQDTRRELIFLTNNLNIPALSITTIHQLRWRIELFFRWIKGHLRFKHYYSTSPNAVKTQIWIAVCLYLMVAIAHKQLDLAETLHLLSVHPFENGSLHDPLTETNFRTFTPSDSNQLMLWHL
jgi:hypothetical protein